MNEGIEKIRLCDSCCRRQIINDVEEMLQTCWSNCNFSQIEKSDELIQTSQKIFDVLETIDFTSDKIWFCGTVKDEVDYRSTNSLPYLSTCFMLLASGIESDQLEIKFEQLVCNFKRFFNNQRQFLNCLMENDDRLFYCLFSLMRLEKKIPSMPEFFDPLQLSLMLLCEIDFSGTTFIDWLCSETVFLVFSINFFKLLHLKFNEVSNVLVKVNEELKSWNKPTSININDESGSFVANFTINELHGSELVQKTYQIREQSQNGGETIYQSATSNRIYTLKDLTEFISNLRIKLESLNQKKLLPFNVAPLVRVIKSVEDLNK